MTSRTGDILLRAKLIDQLQLRSALAHQQQWGGRLTRIVVEKRFVKEDAVVEALAKALGVPRVELDKVEKDSAALAKLDAVYAREKCVFPCALKDGGKTLWVAMTDPSDIPIIDELQLKTRTRIKTVVSGETEILAAIDLHYLGKSPVAAPHAFGAIELSDDGGGEDEGKVVDISGRTLIRNLNDIKPPEPAKPTVAPTPTPVASRPAYASAAGDLLDDLMGEGPGANAGWSSEDLQRLHAIQDQQEKGARILRAILELCVEKGFFRVDEYRAKLTRG